MIGRKRRMLLGHYVAKGASKSALARQLGISQDTITGGSGQTISIGICSPPRARTPSGLRAHAIRGILQTLP